VVSTSATVTVICGILFDRHPLGFLGWNLRLPLNNFLLRHVFLPWVQPTTIINIISKCLTMRAKIWKSFVNNLHIKRKAFPLYHKLMKKFPGEINVGQATCIVTNFFFISHCQGPAACQPHKKFPGVYVPSNILAVMPLNVSIQN